MAVRALLNFVEGSGDSSSAPARTRIGYAAIANLPNDLSYRRTKYGIIFLMATGLYASVPSMLVWIFHKRSGHCNKATATALQFDLANCGGFVSVLHSQKAGNSES